jgi:3-(3-hydroxy-phenyl)propionate hydroxylase
MVFDEMTRRSETGTGESYLSAGKSAVDVDVLIVGMGPVGAMIANLLGRYGVRTLAVEKSTELFVAPRAIALDNEALRILQQAGIGERDFEQLAVPSVRLISPQLGEFGAINTLGPIDGHPKLVTFYQPELELMLRMRLERYECVNVLLGATLIGLIPKKDHVVANIHIERDTDLVVRARYVVGTDGASSLVRRLIGQKFEGKTYIEDWLIVDAQKRERSVDRVEFFCDHRRPGPHLPAPGGRERWEFRLHPEETREDMESDARIKELLAPWGTPQTIDIERRAVYRFHARVADAFRKGRVFLAGDAAHVTPPFIGQGLVAGLRDALNLSWKLAWAIKGHVVPDILDSYDEERRPHAKAMIDLAQLMGKLVMPRNAVTALLIHGFMRLSRWIPTLRRYVEEFGVKPKSSFARGLFVKGHSAAKVIRGSMLPQGYVRRRDGDIRLSDDAIDPRLTLIGFGVDPYPLLEPRLLHQFLGAGGQLAQIAHRGQRPSTGTQRAWEDLTGVFLPGFARVGWLAVVRPDRTILHDGPAEHANQLVRESLDLLGAREAQAEPLAIQAH